LFAGQIERFAMTPTGPDFESLYDRVAESTYVVKGIALESKYICLRIPTEEELTKLGMTLPIFRGGRLFTIAVGQTVCRQADFAPAASQTAPLANPLHIFVPDEEPITKSKWNPYILNVSEHFRQGMDYLLFLRDDPRRAELPSRYLLDPGLTYYRTSEGDRGAVELPGVTGQPRDFVTPLVSAVTALCEAVKAPDVETKIRNLRAVRDHSTDAAWQKSVDAAINALQQEQAKLPQK